MTNRYNLRNYISGFLYDYCIAYPYVAFENKIRVVKCSPAYSGSGKSYGRKLCARSEYTGSSDLYGNSGKNCFLLFGRKFICDSPFRTSCKRSDSFSCFDSIGFDYNPVGIAWKGRTDSADFFNIFFDFRRRRCQAPERNYLETER